LVDIENDVLELLQWYEVQEKLVRLVLHVDSREQAKAVRKESVRLQEVTPRRIKYKRVEGWGEVEERIGDVVTHCDEIKRKRQMLESRGEANDGLGVGVRDGDFGEADIWRKEELQDIGGAKRYDRKADNFELAQRLLCG
jgi:hypothetical protein